MKKPGGEPSAARRRGKGGRHAGSEGAGGALTKAVRSAVDWGPSPWLLMSASTARQEVPRPGEKQH